MTSRTSLTQTWASPLFWAVPTRSSLVSPTPTSSSPPALLANAAQLLASDASETSALRSKNSDSRSSPTRRTISATSLRVRSRERLWKEFGNGTRWHRLGSRCAPVARVLRRTLAVLTG